MGRKDFHDEAFDEGTLNKLDLFEKYAREWIPVFVSRPDPPATAVDVKRAARVVEGFDAGACETFQVGTRLSTRNDDVRRLGELA